MNTDPYIAIRNAFDFPHWPGPRGKVVSLKNDIFQLNIYPDDGCRITELKAFGYELLRQWHDQRFVFQYGCFPMVPWVGRMKNGQLNYQQKHYAFPVNKPPHAMHGMACYQPWELIDSSEHHAEFLFKLDKPWPWKGEVKQRIALHENELTLTLTISSDHDTFPAAAGWHPWFNKHLNEADQALIVDFPADWQQKTGPDELPITEKTVPQSGPWDDCFGFNSAMSATLTWQNSLRLNMYSSGSFMVIFDKQPDATCVEALSGPPNGINTDPNIVTPDKPLIIETKWQVQQL